MIFHGNKSKIFECELKLKGAKLKDTKARLVFECENGVNVLCHGEIDEYGTCQVEVPPFKKLTDTTGGNAILEVIAEDTMFVPWSDEFTVTTPKEVTVEIKKSSKPKIDVSEIKESEKKFIIREDKYFKKKILEFDYHTVNGYMAAVKNLSKKEKHKLMESIEHFKPKPNTLKWANKIFKDNDSTMAKISMFLREKKK